MLRHDWSSQWSSQCGFCRQALAEEKARQTHERELEVARLRAAQEKILDRRSEMDELRARRCRASCPNALSNMRLLVNGGCCTQ